MKYQVPLYKLDNKRITVLGDIIVEKTSLGVYEIISGQKIRVTAGLIKINEYFAPKQIFVKAVDFNGSHLVVAKDTVKGVHKKRLYNHDKYVKEHKKIKQILK